MTRVSVLALLAATALSSAAQAEGPKVTGVVDLVGLAGGFSENATYDYGAEYWDASGTVRSGYGSVRVGVELAPNLSTQIDGWLNFTNYSSTGFDSGWGPFDNTGSDGSLGAATHLVYHDDSGLFAALFGVIGEESGDGLVGGAGVTLGYFGDTWRVLAQVGALTGLTGYQVSGDTNERFVGLAGTYYLNDDFSITARLQLANLTFDGGIYSRDTTFAGLSLDYRPEGSPVILTTGYEYYHLDSQDPSQTHQETGHQIFVGLRVPFGDVQSLKEVDRAAGQRVLSPFLGQFSYN